MKANLGYPLQRLVATRGRNIVLCQLAVIFKLSSSSHMLDPVPIYIVCMRT